MTDPNTQSDSISAECHQKCESGADGWLVIDARGWRTVHLRLTQAEWFVKGLRDHLKPTNVIPLISLDQAQREAVREAIQFYVAEFDKMQTKGVSQGWSGIIQKLQQKYPVAGSGRLSPLEQLIRGTVRLHELINAGLGDSPEADAVRDNLDQPWLIVSESEREAVRLMSAAIQDSRPPLTPSAPHSNILLRLLDDKFHD